MKTTSSATHFSALCLLFLACLFTLFVPGCKKTVDDPASRNLAVSLKKGKPQPPPTPPPPFYFDNCSNPTINGSFTAGTATSATITMHYINSPGGTYAAFTSATVNGITLKAPAGTLNVGAGYIVYTASGTPTTPGQYNISVSISTSSVCPVYIAVLNQPASGPAVDPGTTVGSTGVVNFVYKGVSVAYKTVRAADGKIWLQQNLGSPQVAIYESDRASCGDYFQWGRWDDGHQSANSPVITGSSSLSNPGQIPAGNPNFIQGPTAGTRWWGVGGLATDTWNGTTASASNGKDPCVALGPGWHLPTAAEWENVAIREDLFGTTPAFQSNLKLPSAGYRLSNGGAVFQNGDIGYYWTNTPAPNSTAKVFFFDNVYNATTTTAQRAEGFSCRCVKN